MISNNTKITLGLMFNLTSSLLTLRIKMREIREIQFP